MPYRIAGIDVHKAMLAVVVADVEVEGDGRLRGGNSARRPANYVSSPSGWSSTRSKRSWWNRPRCTGGRVWDALERDWQPTRRRQVAAGPASGALHLAQAQSNHGRAGRKRDFPDAERLVKRLVAQELIRSFVPDVTQRLWRTVTRRKYQLTRNRVQLQNRLEALLLGNAHQGLRDGV